jgi:hypothetical protein
MDDGSDGLDPVALYEAELEAFQRMVPHCDNVQAEVSDLPEASILRGLTGLVRDVLDGYYGDDVTMN